MILFGMWVKVNFHLFKEHSRKEGTGFSGSDVECARLAGAAANTAATVSVTYSSAHTITGFH